MSHQKVAMPLALLFLLSFSPQLLQPQPKLSTFTTPSKVDMANHNLDSKSPTFSRLFPASRSVSLYLTSQLHSRKMPDAYRPVSTFDQSRDNLEQQRTAVLDDEEMSAVHSNYTACIEDQDSSPSAQDMYRLIVIMAVDVMSKFNEHVGLSTQKTNVVRCMNRYIREITLNLNTARRNLSKRTDDNRLFRFHGHLRRAVEREDPQEGACPVGKESTSSPRVSYALPYTRVELLMKLSYRKTRALLDNDDGEDEGGALSFLEG